MAKAELGTKRRCLSCTAPFYDLDRTPIVCPKCGADYQIVEYVRSRPKWAPTFPIATKTSGAAEPIVSELVEPELADAGDEESIPLNDDEDDSEVDETVEVEHDEAADV